MRDIDVRRALRLELGRRFRSEPGTVIVDELGLAGGICRVDLAAINGHMHGYEIKSDTDTLKRLPAQAEVYNSVFDAVTIVVGTRHRRKAASAIPRWWGILEARQSRGQVLLAEIRRPRPNPRIDPYAIARLLWRSEIVEILSSVGMNRGIASKSKEHLCGILATVLSTGTLRSRVRDCLKSRVGWRSDAQRM